MKIEVSSKSAKIGEKVKRHAEEKVSKLEHFFDRITSVHVILSVEKNEQRKAEIVVAAGGGTTLFSENTDGDPFAAFDLAFHKMEEQLRRHKEKLQDRHRKRPPRPEL